MICQLLPKENLTVIPGTPAQKTDYTRTGTRTKKGALNDLVYSVKRYVLNNFADGYDQDALDLFTGRFVPARDRNAPSALRNPTSRANIVLALRKIAMMVAGFLLLWVLAGPMFDLASPSFFGSLLMFVFFFPPIAFVMCSRKGTKYVNIPRFNPAEADPLSKPIIRLE